MLHFVKDKRTCCYDSCVIFEIKSQLKFFPTILTEGEWRGVGFLCPNPGWGQHLGPKAQNRAWKPDQLPAQVSSHHQRDIRKAPEASPDIPSLALLSSSAIPTPPPPPHSPAISVTSYSCLPFCGPKPMDSSLPLFIFYSTSAWLVNPAGLTIKSLPDCFHGWLPPGWAKP